MYTVTIRNKHNVNSIIAPTNSAITTLDSTTTTAISKADDTKVKLPGNDEGGAELNQS